MKDRTRDILHAWKDARTWLAVVCIALLFVYVYAARQSVMMRLYERNLEFAYQKNFYDMVDGMNEMETNLAKLSIAGDTLSRDAILNNIWRRADALANNVAQLPSGLGTLNGTLRFINQLGDYSNSLQKATISGGEIAQKDYDNIVSLYEHSNGLNKELRELETQLALGEINWLQLTNMIGQDTEENTTAFTNRFTQLEESSIEYPTLIYDGPFSDAVLQREPLGLGGEQLDQNECARKAIEFLGGNAQAQLVGESGGPLPCYTYICTMPGFTGTLDVSKTGGHIVRLTSDATECTNIAQSFLNAKGFSMIPTYNEHYDGVAVINFAGFQDGIVYYPDLIKVKVSMGGGHHHRVGGFTLFIQPRAAHSAGCCVYRGAGARGYQPSAGN